MKKQSHADLGERMENGDRTWQMAFHRVDKALAVLETIQRKDIESQSAALVIQTGELSRRLDDLNHEAAQLKSMQATYWPRELAEQAMKELRDAIEELQRYKDESVGRQSILTVVVSAAVSLGFLVLGNFLK